MITVARVLIDSPLPQLDRLFDYEVPERLSAVATPGVRVKVPLRTAGRVVEGWLIERAEITTPERPISQLDSVVSPIALLPASLYRLARKLADRAAGSVSDILRLAIPRRMVRAEKAWLAASAPDAPTPDESTLGWAQAVLSGYPEIATRIAAGERLAVDAPPHPAHGDSTVGAWAELLAAISLTELAAGRSSVIVVPDHRDQAQVLAVLEERAPEGAVVRDDARRSGPERYAAYLRTLSPVPCIVVGNRSAVYAPVATLGALIIWDDGDPLLAEPLSPGIHARDAALVRQELDGGALVLSGHTRTSDVERLVGIGWVHEVAPARRVTPRVILSATHELERGMRVPASAFAAAREALAHGPVLVQVARPGYAPVLACAPCRQPARCPSCTGPLRARRPGAAPECAWCARQHPAWHCPHCSSDRLRMISAGSERTADELGRAFPMTRVILADGEHPVAEVDERPALVIATRGAEPRARGGYRAVLLLDAERMLLAEHLRIGESCLRWWSNAAALAAPGAPVHLVGVAGPVARALATWTQPAYARAELAARAPLLMPPTVRVAVLDGEPPVVARTVASLRETIPSLSESAIVGPVPRGDGTARALVRFEYVVGRSVAEHLRAAVIAEALRGGGRRRGNQSARTTLRVRLDVPELDL